MQLRPIKHLVIFKDRHYNSFPSLIKMMNGKIIAGFRQSPDWQPRYGKVTHVDPSSLAVYVTSQDGETWDNVPRLLYDDFYYGVQDPCLNVLRDGTLFCTFFMWKVYALSEVEDKRGHQVFGKWVGKIDRIYSIRSSDGGETWDDPIPILNIPGALRGNCVELDDGAILAPIYGKENGLSVVSVARTGDRGRTWTQVCKIEDANYHFYEPGFFRTRKGKIIAFIRSEAKNKESGKEDICSPLFTSESLDNGVTWSTPVKRKFYSPSPFHALQLEDGQVLLSFGYRIKPYGIHGVLLNSECTNLDEAEDVVLRDDGLGFDIGYTSAVQLLDGKLLVAYYYSDAENGLRYIAGSLCEIV